MATYEMERFLIRQVLSNSIEEEINNMTSTISTKDTKFKS